LRLTIISKHLFPQKAIKKGEDRKPVLEGNNLLFQCKKGIMKRGWWRDLGEIRFARMLIPLPIKLQNRVMEIYDVDYPEMMIVRLMQRNS